MSPVKKLRILGTALLCSLIVPMAALAQTTGQITGVVTSNPGGQPVSGVLVAVQGTQLSAVTASNGRYTIQGVPAGEHVLHATSLGYAAADVRATVTVGATATVDIQMAVEAIELAEIVAVGYGTQRRREITGSVSSVSERDFVAGPARDVGSLISGQLPGLVVNTPSGNPRSGTEVYLRGITTLSGSRSPLVLIDGVPGDLETVAPNDVESVSVLKDGSAAAIYGSRAQNGVILITTKKHTGGRATVVYDGYLTQQRIAKRPNFLDADDYRRLIGEGVEFDDFGYNTNWMDLVLRQPISYVQNLTLMGGANNTNYTASLSYENSQGIFIRSDNREASGRFNIRHSMYDDRLNAEVNVVTRMERAFDGPSFNQAWRYALIRNPTDRAYDDQGDYQQRETREYTNPLALIYEENGEVEQRTTRVHGTVTFRPITALQFSVLAGGTSSSQISGSATTFKHINTVEQGRNGTASRSTSSGFDRILEITGTFASAIGGHNVNLVGGYSYQDNTDESFSASNEGFPTDLFGYDALETGSGITEGLASVNSGRSRSNLVGFFGRLNYDWNNRLLLMASARYEGNSRFGAGHKWGLFPGVSVGWQLGQESFIKDNLPWVNDLRLRAGYGVTGVAPNQPYLSLTSYSYDDLFPFQGDWVAELGPARNPNPNLKWEEKRETNFGMNVSMFDSRLSGSIDIYQRDTHDLLFNYSVPVPPNLTNNLLANVGRMKNSGIEVELSYDVIDRPGVQWRTRANWSTTRNELVSLSNDVYQANDFFTAGSTGAPIQTYTHRVEVGGPIGNFYGWKSVDIDENGEWIVLDSAGAPIPIRDASERDKHILGNGIPKHFLAWNNSVQVGNFDFNLNMRGAFGFQILNYMRMFYETPKVTLYNMLESAYDPAYGKRSPFYEQTYISYYIENGDYWKIDNATLGYTVNPELLGPLAGAVTGARIYVSGRNLMTFTGYKGQDPEVPFAGNPFTAGTDSRDGYPTTRSFTLGMTLRF